MDKGPNGTIEKFPARKNNDFMIKVLKPGTLNLGAHQHQPLMSNVRRFRRGVLNQPQLVVIGQFAVDIYLARSYNPVHSRIG